MNGSWGTPDPTVGLMMAEPTVGLLDPVTEWLPGFPAEPVAPEPPVIRRVDSVPESTGEPVIIAHAVTVILAAVVTAGWVVIPSPTIDAIATVIGFAVATVGAVLARSKVAPLKGGIWDAVRALVAAEVAKQQR
jgi:hypothetical protein